MRLPPQELQEPRPFQEGHESVAAACVEMHAQELGGEEAALEKAPELSLDEARGRAITAAGPGEKRLEPLRDDPVEDGLVCPAGSVGRRGSACGSSGGVEGPAKTSGGTAMLAL